MNPLILCAYIMLGLLISTLVFFGLSKFRPLHSLISVASVLFGASIIVLMLYFSVFYLYLMYAISTTVYFISKQILLNFLNPLIAYYFSFLLALVFIAYFMEDAGVAILKILKKTHGDSSYDMSSGFKKIVQILKPKLWIYLTTAILTSIASIENLAQISVITNGTWNEVKPFIFEAIVTFIALDTFIVLINKSILTESKTLISSYLYEIYKSIFVDKKSNGSE